MTWRNRIKWKLRSTLNYLQGYAYGPVRRCRRCGHTLYSQEGHQCP